MSNEKNYEQEPRRIAGVSDDEYAQSLREIAQNAPLPVPVETSEVKEVYCEVCGYPLWDAFHQNWLGGGC